MGAGAAVNAVSQAVTGVIWGTTEQGLFGNATNTPDSQPGPTSSDSPNDYLVNPLEAQSDPHVPSDSRAPQGVESYSQSSEAEGASTNRTTKVLSGLITDGDTSKSLVQKASETSSQQKSEARRRESVEVVPDEKTMRLLDF